MRSSRGRSGLTPREPRQRSLRLITRDFRLPRRPHRPDFARSPSVAYEFAHFGLANREPETFRGARSLDAPDPKAWRQSSSTTASVGQALGHATPLAHPERPRRTQPLVAKRRTHAAKRERPGREAGAFTLNRSARQFRARPSVSRGLRPLIGSRAGWIRTSVLSIMSRRL